MCPVFRALREAVKCFALGFGEGFMGQCHVKCFSQPLAYPRAVPGEQW